MAKERLRSIRAEAEALSDTEEEPWRRPLYTSRWGLVISSQSALLASDWVCAGAILQHSEPGGVFCTLKLNRAQALHAVWAWMTANPFNCVCFKMLALAAAAAHLCYRLGRAIVLVMIVTVEEQHFAPLLQTGAS